MRARHIGFGVLVVASLMAVGHPLYVAELTAAPPPPTPSEWAAAPALGDVLVSTGNQVKVFGHAGNSKADDTITFGTGENVTASAFDAGLNLFVATQTGQVVKVDRSTTHAITPVVSGLSPAATSIVFDADGNFYLGFPGSLATIKKYDLTINPQTLVQTFTPSLTYPVPCDATLGLWMDLAPQRPDDDDEDLLPTQRMYYTCGGRQVRYFDVLAATVDSILLTSLPNPGTARDLRLLPPKAGEDAVAGGFLIADDRNVKFLNSLGQLVGTFDTDSINGWSSVELSPVAGWLWAARADTPIVYRFQLPANLSAPFAVTQTQVQILSSNFTAPIASLAVNGGYRSAVSTRLLKLNTTTPTVTATYLDHTKWAHSWELSAADFVGDVQLAATFYEGGRVSDVAPDFNLTSRLTAFSTASPIYAYRERAAFVRAVVQTSSVDFTLVSTLVTMNYLLPTFPNGLQQTVLLDDPDPVSYVGFSNTDQFETNIRREWFKTEETIRGGTKGLNDFLVATDANVTTLPTVITAPTGTKTYQIDNQVPIRAKVGNGVDRCADMVLTIARATPVPSVIVGSSETTLTDSRGIQSVFTFDSRSGNCQANVRLHPGTSELPGETDFAPLRTYNFCINFRSPQPDDPLPTTGTPFGDACGTFKTAK
jgi:hypothetical protein